MQDMRRLMTTLDTCGGRPARYAAGRRCATPGCSTILSVYNPASFCCLHDRRAAPARTRRRPERPRMIVVCTRPGCGKAFATDNPRRRYCSDRCRVKAFEDRQRVVRQAAALTS